jgi:hypothetical protein
MSSVAVARLNVFVGLLIGGLQHASFGMGHTIAVFFLLSIYSAIVGKFAKQVALFPEHIFKVRSLLDFISDMVSGQLSYSEAMQGSVDSGSLAEQGTV